MSVLQSQLSGREFSPGGRPGSRSAAPLAFTLAVLALALGSLELVHPRYFSDDDNRDMWLPAMVYNYRSLQRGELAEYSFSTFAGAPQLTNGQ